MNIKRLAYLILLSAIILAGCSAADQTPGSNIQKGSYLTGSNLTQASAGSQPSGFTLTFDQDNQTYGLLFKGNASQGVLQLQLLNADGSAVWKSGTVTGPFRFDELIQDVPAGSYSLVITWDGPVKATYDLYTVPGEAVRLDVVQPIAMLGGLGMLVVAIAFIAWALIRGYGLNYLALGGLAWIVAVVLKFAWAIPLNTPIYLFLTQHLPGWLGENLFNLYVGLLTGVFEVAVVWLFLRYTHFGKVPLAKAMAFGIGFGAIEALLLGGSNLLSALAGMLASGSLTNQQLGTIAAMNNPLMGLAPISERFFTILVHLGCNLALFYAIADRKTGFLWLSFAFKSLLDAVAAWAQLNGVQQMSVLWSIEAVVAVFGLVSWYAVHWMKAHYPSEQPAPAPAEE